MDSKQTARLSAGAAMKSLFAFFHHRAFSRQSEGRASIRSYQRVTRPLRRKPRPATVWSVPDLHPLWRIFTRWEDTSHSVRTHLNAADFQARNNFAPLRRWSNSGVPPDANTALENGGQVEGRFPWTQSERNDTGEHRRALKSKRIHGDPSLREQGVGSSNLPAPTSKIKRLGKAVRPHAPETRQKQQLR